ncbi:hypothetical protein [Roseomonas fluvialis]|uniref:Uncharacterized protein n=1 Tax=Roseomonas fluvialis TaxID=1750527 RepID=A0ABN6P606_9PROT|nr:hypothetical protein [Roseomonas fluvialis]BDG74095.1 hypothetical protein Rmf_40240 [Roseomonas fluvialis]
MTHDPVAAMRHRARHHAEQEARAEREALARLLTDPALVLVTRRMGITDLAAAATTGRIAAGPMLRLLTAAADLAGQARALAKRSI